MNLLWYVGIGAAGLVALKIYNSRTASIAASSSGNVSSGGMQSTPLFMGMGGGLSADASPVTGSPLGGDGWSSGAADTGPSDDVLIAQLNKDIALAQIAAQKEIASKGFEGLFPKAGSLGATAGLEPYPLPPDESLLQPLKPIKPKTNHVEAIDFTRQAASKGEAGYMDIYKQAVERGYSANEVAVYMNQAGHKTNSKEVANWIKNKGLRPLQSIEESVKQGIK